MSRSVGLAGVEDASENLIFTACFGGDMCHFLPGQRCGCPDPEQAQKQVRRKSLLVSLTKTGMGSGQCCVRFAKGLAGGVSGMSTSHPPPVVENALPHYVQESGGLG